MLYGTTLMTPLLPELSGFVTVPVVLSMALSLTLPLMTVVLGVASNAQRSLLRFPCGQGLPCTPSLHYLTLSLLSLNPV